MDVKGFLIDLDGVLYVGDTALEGALQGIDFLKERGYRFRFVSNTTRKCRRTLAKKLRLFGFAVDETSIFTPPLAAIAWMKAEGKHRCMLLTTGDVYKDFEQWCNTRVGSGPVDYVVVGDAGDTMTYRNLNRAFRVINDGAEIIALEKDRFWMTPEGLMLSAGPFVAALEYATGKSATVMGKPSRDFFSMALSDMGLPACDVVMIGDDIVTDVGGAKNAGMRAILVRTGKFSQVSLERSTVKPDAVIDSIAGIGDLL